MSDRLEVTTTSCQFLSDVLFIIYLFIYIPPSMRCRDTFFLYLFTYLLIGHRRWIQQITHLHSLLLRSLILLLSRGAPVMDWVLSNFVTLNACCLILFCFGKRTQREMRIIVTRNVDVQLFCLHVEPLRSLLCSINEP